MHTTAKPLLGGKMEIRIDAPDELAGHVAEIAFEEGSRLERIFNLFSEKSEISRLNRLRSMIVSRELAEVTREALRYCRLTAGQYDISLGKRFMARKKGFSEPSLRNLYTHISVDGARISLSHPEIILDLGSISKGYIVDRIADLIIEIGIQKAIIDGRGDLRLIGEHEVGIKHPRNEGDIGVIKVKDMAVATSGDYSQFIGSHERSHIVNKGDLISATVIARDCMTADMLATVLCVTEDPARIIKEQGICAMTVDRNLKVDYYLDFEDHLQ